MAKTRAPILSFGAKGQIAKTQVYGSWKGVSYAREYVVPANPNTTAQQETRSTFSFLQAVWKQAPSLFRDPWQLAVRGKPLTDRNLHTKNNLANLANQADLANYQFSPGALGGLPPTSIAVTPGVGTLTVDVTEPSVLPQGWTIASAVVAVIKDGDPQSTTEFVIDAGEDVSTPYSVVISGLDSVLYRVGAWLKWNRPQGDFAYSPSIHDSGTPT